MKMVKCAWINGVVATHYNQTNDRVQVASLTSPIDRQNEVSHWQWGIIWFIWADKLCFGFAERLAQFIVWLQKGVRLNSRLNEWERFFLQVVFLLQVIPVAHNSLNSMQIQLIQPLYTKSTITQWDYCLSSFFLWCLYWMTRLVSLSWLAELTARLQQGILMCPWVRISVKAKPSQNSCH